MYVYRKALWILITGTFLLAACGQRATEVKITLKEFGIQSSMTDFQAGVPYHFVITNDGIVNHEFMIMPPMTENMMGMDMQELDQMALAMVEEDELTPGTTKSLDFTFAEPAPAGTLEFACHTPDHYEQGMKLPITVK